MKYYISYATNNWKKSQEYASREALKFGADRAICYGPEDIDNEFVNNNIKILSNRKGGGLWLWKPYIILKTLNSMKYGDKLIYCDSGMYPIANLKYLFDLVQEKSVALFQVHNHLIKDWTTKKCLNILNCDDEIENLEQVCGAPQVYKKTDQSIQFVQKVLEKCQIYDAIHDFGCDRHRHDQSILSILSYKEKVEIYRDPSQWGNNKYRSNSPYPQIFNLHRRKQIDQ